MNNPQLAQAIYDALKVKMSFAEIIPAVERLRKWRGLDPILIALTRIIQDKEQLETEYKILSKEYNELKWRLEQLEK